MKSVIMALGMGLCITSTALHAASPITTGVIQFSGALVEDTCVGTVLPTPGPGLVQNRTGCGDMPASGGNAGTGPAYTESMATIAGHSGVDVLDYYIDNLHAVSVASVHLFTRDYD